MYDAILINSGLRYVQRQTTSVRAIGSTVIERLVHKYVYSYRIIFKQSLTKRVIRILSNYEIHVGVRQKKNENAHF